MSVKHRWKKGILITVTAILCCLLPLPCLADEGTADGTIPEEEQADPEPAPVQEETEPAPAASSNTIEKTGIPYKWYRTRSARSAPAAKKEKYRIPVLTEEMENCLESLDSMRSPVAAGVSREAEIEILGDWELSADHEARLKALLENTRKKGFHVGIVMIDVHTGKGIAVHGKREFYSASSIKGPYIVSLAAMYPKTVKTRMDSFRAVAVNSDNAVYSGLVNQYGRKHYNAWRKAADADAPLDRGHYASVSAEALTQLWLLNYQFFTTNRKNGWPMGELFERPNYSAIKPVLGGRYQTQTKAGWIGEKVNAAADAGIVYAGDDPYILAIVSDYRGTLQRLEPYVGLMDEIHAQITGRAIVPFQ